MAEKNPLFQHDIDFPWRLIIGGVVIVSIAFGILIAIFLTLRDSDEHTAIEDTPIPATATIFIVGVRPSETVDNLPSPTNTLPQNSNNEVSAPTEILESPTFTPTFTLAPPTRLPATITSSPTRTSTLTPTLTSTATPTHTATVTSTFTPSPVTPTSTGTITPSATNTATPLPPTPTSDAPTVAYPNGRLVRFYYDEYSFYVWNPSAPQITLSPLTFESLDSFGLPSGRVFSGQTWAQFYHSVEATKCTAIETTQAPAWLRPTQCSTYNAIVTPQRTSRLVFWISGLGNPEFRILWNGEEIGRCPTGAGECHVFLP